MVCLSRSALKASHIARFCYPRQERVDLLRQRLQPFMNGPVSLLCIEKDNFQMEIAVNQQLKAKLNQAFQLTYALVSHLDETSFNLDLPNLPSNRIADQLWCIVGARESYTRAIEKGAWQGFSCSLATPKIKKSVLASLEESEKKLNDINFMGLADAQIDLAFNLLEHEIQHHGQLIRFVYANGLTFPESWHKRYTV
jgi:hypothetical protein